MLVVPSCHCEKAYCWPDAPCGVTTLKVQLLPGVHACVRGARKVDGLQPLPEVVTVKLAGTPEAAAVTSTSPFGIVGTNDTPLKTELAGAVSSSVNAVPGLVIVVVAKVSVIP